MTTPKNPTNTALPHASVGTRWHQLSGILGFLLVGPLAGWQMLSLVERQQLPIWLCFLVGGLGMVLPGVLAMLLQPMRQSVSVDAGGLRFGRHGWVPFSEIDQMRYQSFLTLHRPGRATLIVQQGKHDLDAFNRFCESAWGHWFDWQRIHGTPPGAQRRAALYDRAKIAGLLTVGGTLFIGTLALMFNLTLPVTALLILAGVFITGLIVAIFYGA
ncbi:hypothetical protein [Microbulbifer halophilus]|uniref:Uncharacterized protein n=1 Tax=Microbulbifer halophilus TaxID=453963 RepID=A0ABW5EEA0_9GAMM|nr:hypothetical protein [Microbulbifer halophilus]MCW8125761.1 hypothetical protein [Microbulbifer halophilus]